MTKSSWPEHQMLALLSCALLVAVACLPTSATEPVDDDQVSSRKSNTKPPATVSTAQAQPTKTQPAKQVSATEPSKADGKAKGTEPSGQLELSPSTDDATDKSSANPKTKSSDSDAGSGSAKSKEAAKSQENVLRTKAPDSSAKPADKSADKTHADKGTNKPGETTGSAKSKVVDPKAKLVEGKSELSIEAQQQKDQGECPGSEGSKVAVSKNLNDIPLDQDDHPFDAPVAESEPDAVPLKTPARTTKTDSPKPLSEDSLLEDRINLCLAHYYRHQESLTKRSPWAVMHTILPYGVETNVMAGNREVNAIGWMCYNGVCKTQRMFQSTNSGFRTNVGPGVQGHEGQFLAILAQSSVPRSFPILVGKTRYTVSDLIRYEMVTCREKSELTFKLIGLSHYLAPQQSWRDDRGHTWNLEKLVREELDQPVVGAACGGTHRLMGLSYALMMRRRYKQPINNHWARADAYVQDFVQYAWTLQNPDGSFSTDWFEGRANEPNAERKVQTTGHILEWLIFTLPDNQLDDPRIVKSVEFLLSQVYDHRDQDWPIGPRGHSLRAISLYNQRVLGAPTGQLKGYLAQAGYLKDLR